MLIKISICVGGDVQSQWVSLIPPVYLTCTSAAMRETDSKEILPPGFGFYLSAFYLNMWITVSVHAGFHFQLQDNLHLKFGFRLLRGRNYLQCANVNVECNCPGDWWYIISRVFVKVLYFSSVSLPSLLQAQFTPLLSPKRKGKAIEMFPEEWLIFTLQGCSRIATPCND